MKNKNYLFRFLGVTIGLAILLGSLLSFFASEVITVGIVLSELSGFLFGVVFIYFGFTNRSIVKDILNKWFKK